MCQKPPDIQPTQHDGQHRRFVVAYQDPQFSHRNPSFHRASHQGISSELKLVPGNLYLTTRMWAALSWETAIGGGCQHGYGGGSSAHTM